jgi:aspartate/methionine/tyrosine aminotransferase
MDPQEFFQLKPLKAAKVSEISEATAASPVPAKDRVNLHIGNPVQDERLIRLYESMILGEGPAEELTNHQALLNAAVRSSIPYTPRGGYLRENPGQLINFFREWLSSGQSESLTYDFGAESGRREVIIVSGGKWEYLRVLFHSINRFLVHVPARIMLSGLTLPDHLQVYPNLRFSHLPDGDADLSGNLEAYFAGQSNHPVFLILGRPCTESARRSLRKLSLQYPLFFVELNDAPNHLSLAREARLQNRVLRFISSAAFCPVAANLSLAFAAGEANIIRVLENIHFELKGTPPAAEIELLTYLYTSRKDKSFDPETFQSDTPASEDTISVFGDLTRLTNRPVFGETFLSGKEKIVGQILQTYENRVHSASGRISGIYELFRPAGDDTFAFRETGELLSEFLGNLNNPEWLAQLVANLTTVFAGHQPQYDPRHLYVISGSARTAFSLLGMHCGFSEALVPDLSWTYQHGFGTVHTTPLNRDYNLDPQKFINAVENLIGMDPDWSSKGFVVLNNPHNASGMVFSEGDLSKILSSLLSRNIFVIDDLSYQNIRPGKVWPEIKTLRRIASELRQNGYLTQDNLDHLITIHSLSKTDCFAGARLAFVELMHPHLSEKFRRVVGSVHHNFMAILLAYFFYRNGHEELTSYWQLRNLIMDERMRAIENAEKELPPVRNPFHIKVVRPKGSMYPHLVVSDLPPGLSLDWLASGLARNGIGMIPLSTFSQTAEGYEDARKTFRLTLGGTESADVLNRKMRRVIIDLNRLIGEESVRYNQNRFAPVKSYSGRSRYFPDRDEFWQSIRGQIAQNTQKIFPGLLKGLNIQGQSGIENDFFTGHMPFRLETLHTRMSDRVEMLSDMLARIQANGPGSLAEMLAGEFYKESGAERAEKFRHRLFDRTVHPTQMYALSVDLQFERVLQSYISGHKINPELVRNLATALISEFIGRNVPVRAIEEGDELVHDLLIMILSEEFIRQNSRHTMPTFLSFWGDWDGSNRPSGQGHLLVAAVLIENVLQQANILQTLLKTDRSIPLDRELQEDLHHLPVRIQRFWNLLNRINALTNQLEKRYQSIVPADIKTGPWRKAGLRLRLIRDPLKAIWQHNDRLERHMLELRRQRSNSLEYYFSLNKRLRKFLYNHIGNITGNLDNPALALQTLPFRNLLKRYCLTPRIHQNMITSTDQFAIDTTVENLLEINTIAGKYGNPSMVLALQVSMSTQPEAFIAIDRKIRSGRDKQLREHADIELPPLWIIPLFEDTHAVTGIGGYLDTLWNYAIQSRRIEQKPDERLAELLCEIFIAGSDLSQQVSQPAAARLYRSSKFEIIRWLSAKGMVDRIRIKFGSGEPMQRQGGYFLREETNTVFRITPNAVQRLDRSLSPSARTSTSYARRPLKGILASGEFRTFQSNLFERIKLLSAAERAQLIFHVQQAQRFHEHLLIQASEPFIQTRLQPAQRGIQEIERLTVGQNDPLYREFTDLVTRNFRHILYGREEDVVGLHIISYFISRATPVLRDRPTVRPTRDISQDQGQKIIRRIAQTLPLARHGSLLRAIGHNQAQTMVLGINQLTTGLFRSFQEFAAQQRTYRDGLTLISDRILPLLPVYEILNTLRLYHNTNPEVLDHLIRAFPAGNTAFLILREDIDSIPAFIVMLQKEYLRRHGLNVTDFFEGDKIITNVLPSFAPDIAVLLQPDLFNTDPQLFLKNIGGYIDPEWEERISLQLQLPEKIQNLRRMIWQLVEEPLFQQVKSFVELAMALNTLTLDRASADRPFAMDPSRVARMSSNIVGLLRGIRDDSMREFLLSVVQYLSHIPQNMRDVPINILRALEDIETIIKIEEQTLSPKDQDVLRFYMLQIARIAGENG